jgi:predicted RNA-binding protein with PUA domain
MYKKEHTVAESIREGTTIKLCVSCDLEASHNSCNNGSFGFKRLRMTLPAKPHAPLEIFLGPMAMFSWHGKF